MRYSGSGTCTSHCWPCPSARLVSLVPACRLFRFFYYSSRFSQPAAPAPLPPFLSMELLLSSRRFSFSSSSRLSIAFSPAGVAARPRPRIFAYVKHGLNIFLFQQIILYFAVLCNILEFSIYLLMLSLFDTEIVSSGAPAIAANTNEKGRKYDILVIE